ncbi:hypothetical protein E2562_036491 [Oryza meyeriana var. granulata]|uniref:Uncharacterized protein n=1 Tax=Oryza meyeriana var. granulata TaxID=110450 RepID=A0A6G1CA44_9ORYZ|nr:hypothetical protein E2562_036491 [Oryza meyeriana var. granulata]
MRLASPGAKLAWQLVEHHGVMAMLFTFANLTTPNTHSAVLSSLPASVATATLLAVSFDDLPTNVYSEMVLFELVKCSLPHLRVLMQSICSTAGLLITLVPDVFCALALFVPSRPESRAISSYPPTSWHSPS